MMSDHSKRTRSQLASPDEFGEVHFGISPLRAARQERRKNLQSSHLADSSGPPESPNVGVDQDESDDELLLSPPKARSLKRPHVSQQPGFSPEVDTASRYKRPKQNHDDEPSHVPVTDTKQPNGPFDFFAINPKLLLSSVSPGQRGMSSKQRAHTVPLLSPTICRRNLGQLMPSHGNVSIVPPVHETLRFSSLPCSLEPSADAMDVDNIAKPSDESERAANSLGSRTSPSQEKLDSSSSCRTPVVEDKGSPTIPTIDQLPLVTPSTEVIPSNVSGSVPPSSSDSPATPQHRIPGEPDSDVTPRPIDPPLTLPLDVNPIPITFSGPFSLSDDPLSPLSALSSLSELDDSPSPPELEINDPRAGLPSGIPRPTGPPLPPPSHDTTKVSAPALPPAARPAASIPRGGEVRALVKPSRSAMLTRSASTKKDAGSVDGDVNTKQQGGPSSVSSSVPAKRSADSAELATQVSKKPSSMAGSHKKSFSFAMPTSSSLNRTVEKAPASSPAKPSSLPKRQLPKLAPSPTKPASSLGPGEPPHSSKHTGLSNLSLALEKLKIPPPSRPATSLGFNSDTRFASNAPDPKNAPKAKDDSTIKLGNGLPSSSRATATPLRRVATVGSVASFKPNTPASDSKPVPSIATPSAHHTGSGPPVKKINLQSGIIVGKNSLGKPKGFAYRGVGNKRLFEKVSKKSTLPVVEASPVKGTGTAQPIDSNESALPLTGETLIETLASCKEDNGQEEPPAVMTAVEPMRLEEALVEHGNVLAVDGPSTEDGQAEPADVFTHASRRASLASQFLQQTLAVLPSTPPPTKASGSKSKATERSQPSSQNTRSGLRSGSHPAVGSRGTSKAPSKSQAIDARVSRLSSTAAASSSTTKPSSLKVLKLCTIFVDVRTDDGDDAGGLFVDMLKGLGAKIIGRAGQSCTHIVYKNGLMSTLTKYRLMREPKPFVVGISWVVECAEQCRRVGEENFLVDLEGLNVAGNNKRRRSMLPKHISSGLQSQTMAPPSQLGLTLTGTLATATDQSMDGSSGADRSLYSSDGPAEDEDDIPPLERARQRRNIFFRS